MLFDQSMTVVGGMYDIRALVSTFLIKIKIKDFDSMYTVISFESEI